ncbi:MAG TPA: hypothetical protein VHU40_14365, partial [Polyangia bacterium]|nr:hypothetical protein [Polyangia bacterium]
MGLTAAPPAAHANIRAPLVQPQPPSSALRPSAAAAELQVLDETLAFRCGQADCDVDARYRIKASDPATVELAFVLPTATPISVKVGAAASPIEVTPAPPEFLRSDNSITFETQHLSVGKVPIFQARFRAALVAGENTVVVTYRQPLGRREYDHSYFSKGRWVQFFRYELWPLSEWKHAPGFKVHIATTIHRPPPSWWKRTFSKVHSVG